MADLAQLGFAWPVAGAGYEWIEGRLCQPEEGSLLGDETQWLVPVIDPTREPRTTYPMTKPTILWEFFQLAGDEVSGQQVSDAERKSMMLDFVNAHGLLTRGLPVTDVHGQKRTGESFTFLHGLARNIFLLTGLVDLGKDGDPEAVEQLLRFAPGKPFDVIHAGPNVLVERLTKSGALQPELDADLSALSDSSGVLPLARRVADRLLNRSLLKVETQIVYDPESNQRKLCSLPTTLVGCLVLQVAQMHVGESESKTCTECQRAFVISESLGTRRHRKFCSAACKISAHRKRMERALAMSRGGKKPAAIAKDLGTKAATVRGWIKKAEKLSA